MVKPIDDHMHQIIDLIPASIYWKDITGHYLGCNKYVVGMVGASGKNEIIGKTDYELPWKDIADDLKEIDQYVVKKGYYEIEEYPVINNKQRTFLTIKKSFSNDNGEVIGIIGISTDITDRIEKELLTHENRKLEVQNKLHQAIYKEQEKFRKIVGQVVHDIQSPLSSLRGLVDESGSKLPEEERITLRQASMRISAIANHMLSRYKNEDAKGEDVEAVLVSTAIHEVISEKRYEHKAVNFVTEFLPIAKFDFIYVEPDQFKRMISNVLNNAVQALGNKPDGKIEIRLNSDDEWVMITIADNGKGMPNDLLDKIKNNIAVTEGKQHGSGIGLTQARDVIQRNFGEFDISSTVGFGTSILFRFPKVSEPAWIASNIKITKGDTIVILDDDDSIHSSWNAKLAAILAKLPGELTIKHFSDGEEAVAFINSIPFSKKDNIYLLTDYELLSQDINGLQVIEQTSVKRATLVTSHYANKDIRKHASDLRVKILPKELTSWVRINLNKNIEPGSRKVDIVWVDDTRSFIKRWQNKFKDLVIDAYHEPNSFLEDVHQYPLDTKIILDRLYYDGRKSDAKFLGDGLDIARVLHEKGYTNVFMVTGEVFNVPDDLTVILKSEDEKIEKLIRQ